MKKTISQRFFLSLCLMIVGCLGGAAWAETVTYTVTSTSAVSTSGTAPFGSSATYSSKYNEKFQLIGGKSMTLTLSGYAGKKITGITLSMKSNSNSGAGYLSVKAGNTTLASIGSSSSGVKFNNRAWYGKWSTSYVNVTPTMSNDAYAIQYNEDVVILIGATTNSLYCQSFTLTYEDAGPTLLVPSEPISFGDIETGYNDTKTFSISGMKLTADATLEITGTNAAMFSVSPTTITATDGNIAAKDVTVTYTPTTTGTHSATLTISSGDLSREVSLSGTGIAPLTHYTVSWMVNGETYTEGTPSTDVAEGKKVETLPTNPAAIGSNVFMGWRASTISGTLASAPDGLFTTAKDAPVITGETTYYAVFAKREGSEPTEVLNQTLTYDTWTYYGSTTKKNNYRLFHTDSYIESTEFDLSKLSKVIVYGGTFGGDSYNKLSIGDGTNTWKDVTVSGSEQTGVNTYTDGTPLSGTGTLRVTSKSGTAASSTGVRISKVQIYIMTGGYTYSNYATTIATQPAANIHATTYYKKITSSDELVDGGVYLIVCESRDEAMGVIDDKRCLGAAITLNGNTYTGSVNQSSYPYEVTITKDKSGYYNLYHAGGMYITSTSTDFAFAAKGDNGWSISFDNSGNAIISNKNTVSHFIQRYSSDNYYKNYQSGQEAIQLYQKVGEMPIAKATGYVSTYVADFAYVMPKHITGHTVTLAAEQGVISTEKVFRAGDEVPALTPLLIKSDEDYAEDSKNYHPAVLNKTVEAYKGDNMLEYRRTAQGLTNTMKDESVYYYKLAIKSGNVGFYWGAENGAAFTMTKPSTAYLTVPQSTSVQGFVLNLEEGETTGIATVVTNEDAPIYNLQGIRMNGKNLPKGIYIQGGKKFMVK